MQWYYLKDGQRVGPLDDEAFEALVKSGEISPETQIWNEGLPAWQSYATVMGKPKLRVNKRELSQPDVGKVMERINPADLVSRSSGQKRQDNFTYAGIWLRAIATFIDSIVMTLMLAGFGALGFLLKRTVYKDAQPTRTLYEDIRVSDQEFYVAIALVAIAFISVFFYKPYWIGKTGATAGKKLLKLKVIRRSGEPVTAGRAMGRFFAEYLSSFIFAIGYLMVAFDSQKRALHDRICDTRVIRTTK